MSDIPGTSIESVFHSVYGDKSINYVDNMRNAVVSSEARDMMRRYPALRDLQADETTPHASADVLDAAGAVATYTSHTFIGLDYGGFGARDLTYGDIMHHLLNNVVTRERVNALNLLEALAKIDNVEINLPLYQQGLEKGEAAIGRESF